MKLRDLIAQTKPSPTHWLDGDAIAEEAGVGLDFATDLAEHGFQETSVISWLCTDMRVGLNVVFLDGEPVLHTWQPTRKGSKEIHWHSREAIDKVRKRLLEIPREESRTTIADLDEEISDEGFHVSYGTDLLTRNVIWQSRPARVVKTYGVRVSDGDHYTLWSKVDLEVDGVVHEKVSLSEIFVPYDFGGEA